MTFTGCTILSKNTPFPKGGKKSLGFTLIEFIIVIILISLLGVMVLPLWPGTSINVAAQADQLVSDLQYTQMLSVTTGTRYHLTILSTNTYQIQDSAGTAIIYPGTGSTTISLNSGITFGTLTNLPNNLVTFDGEGTPYSDTNIPGTALTAIATIPLNSSSATATIAITPLTGRIYQQ